MLLEAYSAVVLLPSRALGGVAGAVFRIVATIVFSAWVIASLVAWPIVALRNAFTDRV